MRGKHFPHAETTGEIIGAAMAVLNALKPGLAEKVYENALVIELQDRGIRVERQASFPVHYKGHHVGTLIPDLIVDGKVIVDTKVVESFNDSHTAQMLGYLAITNLEVGLLLNFKYADLRFQRFINTPNRKDRIYRTTDSTDRRG